jgi:hypothetical protein
MWFGTDPAWGIKNYQPEFQEFGEFFGWFAF